MDGPENGEPPMPWAIPVSYKKPFHDDKIKKEVPHTAKVKVRTFHCTFTSTLYLTVPTFNDPE